MRIISGSARGTKLYTLNGNNTRPTLDRIKESLFNILNVKLQDSVILDLFSGSGALAIESLSRGAKFAYIVDNSYEAIKVINKNIQKTHMEKNTEIYKLDYKRAIEKIDSKLDIIFIDPPYEANIAVNAVKLILEYDLLSNNGIIIIETDQLDREIDQLTKIVNIEIYNTRDYGRVKLIFLSRKG